MNKSSSERVNQSDLISWKGYCRFKGGKKVVIVLRKLHLQLLVIILVTNRSNVMPTRNWML